MGTPGSAGSFGPHMGGAGATAAHPMGSASAGSFQEAFNVLPSGQPSLLPVQDELMGMGPADGSAGAKQHATEVRGPQGGPAEGDVVEDGAQEHNSGGGDEWEGDGEEGEGGGGDLVGLASQWQTQMQAGAAQGKEGDLFGSESAEEWAQTMEG